MSILENINKPSDIKQLSYDELKLLASEIREEIIKTVSENGGHLSSNLGAVELTIALHRVFNAPEDKLIFDVGHQTYTHKLLTGRRELFSTLRTYGGISGFEKMSESEYDAFGTGHSSTSLSAAVGIATAFKLDNNPAFTVAVAGDGAFTGGMLYEAMNNCSKTDLHLIIILNDNEMSISPNVGGLSRYFARVRVSSRYFRLKSNTKRFFLAIPLIGESLVKLGRWCKESFKRLVTSENLFEHLGIEYLGPVNDNDIQQLERVLNEAKTRKLPCLVHIRTKKGKGYTFAEEKPDIYHSVGKFDIKTGVVPPCTCEKYSDEFGRLLVNEAKEDKNIIAITAAMCDGTGLTEFAKQFPDRFFDVGIAEEHAVTFAAGLAAAGKKPVFAVYSSFLQRGYDQLIHDVALQSLPVVFAIDRAGIVPDDGPTHHGLFDVSYLSSIPGMEIYSPETFEDLELSLKLALMSNKPSAVRYPRGKGSRTTSQFKRHGTLSVLQNSPENVTVSIITYGRMTANAVLTAEKLIQHGIGARVIKLVRLVPIEVDLIKQLTEGSELIYVMEEGIKQGGIGEKLASMLDNTVVRAIDGCFVPHGAYELLLRDLGFMPEQAEAEICNCLIEKLKKSEDRR